MVGRPPIVVLVFSVAAAVALAAWLVAGSLQGSGPGGGSGGVVVYRVAFGDWGPPGPYSFYPRGPGYVVASFLFDTLVWKDEHGVIPWLAASWESREGGRVWVFHLRRGVRWGDGAPLTAEDVVFTFKYMARHGWHWKNIGPGLVESVEAPDNYTVVIRLRKPYTFFLEDYASTMFILPRHVWEKVEEPYGYTGPGVFTGTGPFILESYEPGKGYVLRANPGYWGGKPLVDKLVLVSVGFDNPQQEANALVSGEVDAAVFTGKAWRLVKMLKERLPGARVVKAPMYWVLFLGFNLDKWPMNETLFRRAVAYSLNLTELVERSVGSLEAAEPGSPGYIPPYSPFYEPRVGVFTPKPSEAEKLLDSLGLRDVNGDGCRDLPNGALWRPLLVASKRFSQEAVIVAEMLRRTGICVEVKTLASMKELDRVVKSGAYDMVINGHGAVGNSISGFQWYFSGRFAAPWRSREYTEVLERIVSAPSREEAVEAAKQAQLLVAKELPRIALYYPYIYLVEAPGSRVHWFFTGGGIDGGIPLPWNKLALLPGRAEVAKD